MRTGTVEWDLVSDGTFRLDGGSMFGVVPKPLWERAAPPDDRNRITLGLHPLLVRTEGKTILRANVKDAEDRIGKARDDAEERIKKAREDAKNRIEKARTDADRRIENARGDAQDRLEKAREDARKRIEEARRRAEDRRNGDDDNAVLPVTGAD